ncbi:hypothetical protein CRG98_034621 [Punica granatum]|uniref:RNase H type-1 domain-containing protein n=1 Tax=Punica granatum TaxID=22663 RepID=A0A2I0ILU6_PUNGR|nr:hypothetical protein CRG98_034621 [Punica granatum]
MDLEKEELVPIQAPLLSFIGSVVEPKRMVQLPMVFGEKPRRIVKVVSLVVVDIPSAYFRPVEELEKVNIGQNGECIRVGSQLPEKEKQGLIRLPQDNKDHFTWHPAEMLGIDPCVIRHRLNITPGARQVIQKRRPMREDGRKVIREEVAKLTNASFIQEVRFHKRVANVTLQKPDVSGRLLKWAIELSEFGLEYQPRDAIKAQALVDFIVEITGRYPEQQDEEAPWILMMDGSATLHGARAGCVLIPPNSEPMKYALVLTFQATNNEAEYEALITGLHIARRLEQIISE